jgi:hypothetical protein
MTTLGVEQMLGSTRESPLEEAMKVFTADEINYLRWVSTEMGNAAIAAANVTGFDVVIAGSFFPACMTGFDVVIAGSFFPACITHETRFKQVSEDIDVFLLDTDDEKRSAFLNEQGFSPGILDSPSSQDYEGGRVFDVINSLRTLRLKSYVGFIDVNINLDVKMQFILTDYKTPQELLGEFDFEHCKIAYYKNKLHLTKNMYECAMSKKLVSTRKKPPRISRIKKYEARGWDSSALVNAGNGVV